MQFRQYGRVTGRPSLHYKIRNYQGTDRPTRKLAIEWNESKITSALESLMACWKSSFSRTASCL